MKKKFLTIMLAGAMAAGMSAGSVQAAAAEDASGDLYVFIAASLSNAMEDIQKDFNKEYPDVNILFNADSSGTLQTQIEEGSRCDVFFLRSYQADGCACRRRTCRQRFSCRSS